MVYKPNTKPMANGPGSYPILPPISNFLVFYQISKESDRADTVIRSFNLPSSFRTPGFNSYIGVDSLLGSVPGMSGAAWWPAHKNTLDLALGIYQGPAGSGPYQLPDENKRWSYNTLTCGWTEEVITLDGSSANNSMRVASGMTSWIPKLNRGYMFGGVFQFFSNTSDYGQETYEHGGLIVYDPTAKIMTNASTPVDPINEGGLVHLTMATDEVLMQFGGRTGGATEVVCSLADQFRVSFTLPDRL